jgi:transmembrane sensor
MAAAAVLLLAVGLAYLTTTWRVEEPISMVEFSTAPDELRTVVLANGTVIRLAPNSTLLAAPGEDLRSVWLQGRAFFAVARHPHRRFAVQTPHGTVSVLGTRFEVGTVDEGLRLLVLDGQVAFAAEGGELAHSSSTSAPVVTRLDAPEKLLDWMGPWVAFEATPLHQVARELEARLGIRIQIGDSALADRTITGWMDEADQDQMMKMICRVAGVRCTQVGDVLRMER